jgi:small subunit ribosomal protein S16
MLAIKLKRVGKKHQASFRIVVAEKRSKLRGRFVEDLGWYNPHTKKSEIAKERVDYWLKVGAQPTATVHNLFVKKGLVKGRKIAVHRKTRSKTDQLETEKSSSVAGEEKNGAVSKTELEADKKNADAAAQQ